MLSISKFGTITKDKNGSIILKDFEFDGDINKDIYINVIEALICEFEIAKADRLIEILGE